MADVAFDFVPSYSSESTMKPRVSSVRFGDGYIQRATIGINLFPLVWDLQFINCSDARATEIENTIKSAAGGTLLWSVPHDAGEAPNTPLKWVCLEGVKRRRIDYNTNVLACTFEQVFE